MKHRAFTDHSLFYLLTALFIVIATFDFINLDSIVYKAVCDVFASTFRLSCTDYYDMPIWSVYLSLAILAALYHVHGEIRSTNRHLKNQNKK